MTEIKPRRSKGEGALENITAVPFFDILENSFPNLSKSGTISQLFWVTPKGGSDNNRSIELSDPPFSLHQNSPH